MTQYDVAIVGSGMVGATLALLLGDAGLSVVLIDAGPQMPTWRSEVIDTRVSAVTAASRALFTSIGIWSAIEARRVSPYTRMQVWDADGTGEINFSADEVGHSFLGHIVENSAILDSLLDRLYAHDNVTMIAGENVVGCQLGSAAESGICERSLTLAGGAEVRAGLVVGADGGRSPLRTMLGIGVSEYATGQTAIVASVRHSRSHERVARQVFLPTGPLAFLPLRIPDAVNQWSSIVWSADDDRASELLSLSSIDFAKELNFAIESRLGEIEEIGPIHSFPLMQRHAQRYILPGFALIGDAAHSLHPLAGQGANLGLMDAAVLSEVLVRAHGRGAPLGDERVLTRYVQRRQADNALMLKMMDAFRIGFGSQQPLVRLVRNVGLRAADRILPVKRIMIRQALGERHDLPKRIEEALKVQ